MTTCAIERRVMRREAAAAHGIVSVRVRPGHNATVVNLSAEGMLIDTAVRLRPGSMVELQLQTAQRRAVLGGRVLRCAVVRLHSSSVWYRAAVAFESHVSWLADVRSSGYVVPVVEPAGDQKARVDPTHGKA